MRRTLVVGGGVFGTSAALELARRGERVLLLDPTLAGHPAAASTDISKVCRMEYGGDALYTEFMEQARGRWLAWNNAWSAAGGAPLYHECGVLVLAREPFAEDGFEQESWRAVQARGHRLERLDAAALEQRVPGWRGANYRDALFNPHGGWVESSPVVQALQAAAQDAGAELRPGRVARLLHGDARVDGVELDDGTRVQAERTVLAGGSWTQELVPELAGALCATGHSVFHLRPSQPELFAADKFPVFLAEIQRTGWYGFPLHPTAGVVKVALHDRGLPLARADVNSTADRRPGPEIETGNATLASPHGLPRVGGGDGWWATAREHLDAFRARVPSLADAELVHARVCPYSDTPDGDFLIAEHPTCAGLVIAAGGSGHAFKFAPLLGDWIADACEGRRSAALDRFAWRGSTGETSGEAARCQAR